MTDINKPQEGDFTTTRCEEINDYICRGREHLSLSQEQLKDLFVAIFHALPHLASYETIFIKMHDVQAEYSLRNVDPPYELVREDAEHFIQNISIGVSRLDADR